MGFTKLKLHQDLLRGIIDTGFATMMPVQEQALKHTLAGRDVYVQSQTGTGKTAAFLVTIFEMLLSNPAYRERSALVIAPTRELAVQIEREAKKIGQHLDFTIGCFFGGVGYAAQEKLIARGVDIIIGTPGRLIDFNQQGKLNFKNVGILVIDEADRLFDMGFLPDLRRMLRKMPAPTDRLSMLFSATLDFRVRELAWEHLNDPVEIEIAPETVTVENVTQELYHVGSDEKMPLLLGILKKEQPGNVLIFTNTKHAAVKVAKRLEINGYPTRYIMGDLPQEKRLKVIDGIKAGKIKYLVATDVAARGLHINDLDMVINYDLPTDAESYVHRIGRTARAGKSGKAITLACDRYVFSLEAIQDYARMEIPVVWPDDDLLAEDKSAGMHIEVERRRQDHGADSRQPRRAGSRTHKADARKPASRTETKPAPAKRTLPARQDEPSKKTVKKSLREMDEAERRAYYQKKYGETFNGERAANAPTAAAPQQRPPAIRPEDIAREENRRPLWRRLLSLFSSRDS